GPVKARSGVRWLATCVAAGLTHASSTPSCAPRGSPDMGAAFAVTRRQFLKTGGALVVGFSLADSIAEAMGHSMPFVPRDFKSVDAWLAIDGNGRVTVYSGHVELGTGVETALTQMVADELDVPFTAVSIIQGDTLLTPDQGPT